VLLLFAAVLAARVEEAGAGPVARHLTSTAATAWAVLTMTGGALWLAVPVGVQFFDVEPTTALMSLSGLPYSVLVSADGRLLRQHLGPLADDEIAQWARP